MALTSPALRARSTLAKSTLLPCLVTAVFAVTLWAPPAASAEFETGVGNLSAPFGGGAQEAALWFDRAEDLGVDLMRVEVSWATHAPEPPIDPADPSSYDFSHLRTVVERAQARGFDVMFTIWWAPAWAEGPNRPPWAPPGSWRPNPEAFGQFATALTTAFDGFHGPRVRYFEVWNEPNLSLFLTPQWKDGRTVISALHYRKMLNAFYRSAKLTDAANQVIAAGVGPSGEEVGTGIDPKNGRRTKPLEFYRELICLKRHRSEPGRCPVKPRFDIAGVHPISRTRPPGEVPNDPDNLSPANLGSLTAAIRAAERNRRILPLGARRSLWATEIWIETNPPDPANGIPIARAGRELAETLHLLWKARVRRVVNYVIRDQEPGADGAGGEAFFVHGGIWHHPSVRHGEVKRPLFDAFRFPFVAERLPNTAVSVWGRSPQSGIVRIERRTRRAWRLIDTTSVGAGEVFTATAEVPGDTRRMRARVGGVKSAAYRVGDYQR